MFGRHPILRAILALLTILSLAKGAPADKAAFEKNFKCPIDGTDFKQQFEGAGTSFGTRLDFKPIGPTLSPWTIPSCPKCGYVFYQATPDKDAIKGLKAFIASAPFKAKKDYPTYYRLAMIRDFLGLDKLSVGDAYIQASWQVESQPAKNKECLQLACQAFTLGLKSIPPEHPHYVDTNLICGELERRLGLFDAATARFNAMGSNPSAVNNPKVQKIIARQLQFIALKDSAPHAIDENLESLVKDKTPGAK